MQVTARKPTVAPVSAGQRISESLTMKAVWGGVPHRGRGVETSFFATLGEEIGGSKVKREKGCGS